MAEVPAIILRLLLKSGEEIITEGPWPGSMSDEDIQALTEKAAQEGKPPPQLGPRVRVGHINYQGALSIKTMNYDENGDLVEEVEVKESGYYMVASDSEINGRFLTKRVSEDLVWAVDESLTGAELESRIFDNDSRTGSNSSDDEPAQATPASASASAPS